MRLEENLLIIRKRNNLSQSKLANKIKVSRQTIYNWENGKSVPDILSIAKLSELYNVSIDDLIKSNIKDDVTPKSWTH
ncbi:helix-turn-helix domain-containing protein [Apilactobacillus kunkeei]|uniref:Helix-turn-helix domain-containing protein n=1 Tax=Apilactobacillus nanyangensis TaxID=2799579 RepID=A0ABT0HXY5_9LACO|nr:MULTISPECIES: helix-turn-helix transcriptional regulator [Apilactobacillus]MCK8611785.1 helix-turn-helix domain-containing protein [Apilactobacillus nanyangensis]MCK8628532.1 helix-turn-helix domain-containing protein [Apilactobacillus kunkeei]MCK8633495.1 helix-turn-helix domain-containing protein [Apilactobacillus kunkeei]